MALDKNERKTLSKGKMVQSGQKAAWWGAKQAVAFAKDPQAYHQFTRVLAEARIVFITRWFWIAEYATLAILALFGLIDLLLLFNQQWTWAAIFFVPVLISFLLWRLARFSRRLLYRQIERALATFDNLLAQGAVTVSEWPRFFLDWRHKRKEKSQKEAA